MIENKKEKLLSLILSTHRYFQLLPYYTKSQYILDHHHRHSVCPAA